MSAIMDILPSLLPLFSILGAIAIGAASPGPSFVLVARTAIAGSRAVGIAAAFGMGLGGMTFASLALLGLVTLLMQVGWLYLALKLIGGAYLLYLAFLIWRGATQPLRMETPQAEAGRGVLRAFFIGLATQLSNPKTAVVYASIFAALLPADPPLWMTLLLPPLLFAVEFCWYCIVAVAFSAPRPRAAYLRSKRWIDRLAGGVMGLLGARLIFEGARG
ncbi:LysE family translocator [uncultured Ferrovibrio sp.]|jgi:Putative threonine efflux protein|uniref:LysE family translocator n=1 Tax=uncultured Ferrovibrio sp. TaxID=1576913 RepID=UPI00262DB8EF|nr:LysE family translocator [uncultured Ferrovibrio sp.]